MKLFSNISYFSTWHFVGFTINLPSKNMIFTLLDWILWEVSLKRDLQKFLTLWLFWSTTFSTLAPALIINHGLVINRQYAYGSKHQGKHELFAIFLILTLRLKTSLGGTVLKLKKTRANLRNMKEIIKGIV